VLHHVINDQGKLRVDLVLFGAVHALYDVFFVEDPTAALYAFFTSNCIQLGLA
jgi:hypothetical protein